jgi:hypothetical protein
VKRHRIATLSEFVYGVCVQIIRKDKVRLVRMVFNGKYMWLDKSIRRNCWSFIEGWLVIHRKKLYVLMSVYKAYGDEAGTITFVLAEVKYADRTVRVETYPNIHMVQEFDKLRMVTDEKLVNEVYALLDLNALYVIGYYRK